MTLAGEKDEDRMDEISITIPQLFVIGGLLLVLAELFVGIETGFDLVLIGSIMILSGFVGIFTGSTMLMLILAVALSIVYMAIGRRYIKQRITIITRKTNIDRVVGSTGVVVRTITPESPGMIRVNDEDWRASAAEIIYEKDAVVVQGIEGVTAIVSRVTKELPAG